MNIFFRQLLYFIPIVFLLVGVNYFEDPANLFNEKYESGIAELLAQNYNVTNVVNYNDRSLQKQFIAKLKDCPTEIILGSSRVMQINSSFFPTEKVINNGVGGATLEDDIAIFSMYENKSCKIHKVIMGIDPWLLNDHHDQKRWKTLASEYNSFLRKIYYPKSNRNSNLDYDFSQLEKYQELFSFSYFSTSIKYLLEGIDKTYYPTKEPLNKGFTRMYDGSVNYDSAYRTVTPQKLNERVQENIAQIPIYSLGDFSQLSTHYQFLFTLFVEYLQSQHIEVIFFLAPYHPDLYHLFKENNSYQNVFVAEKYFQDFASKHNIKLIGSFDPVKCNVDKSLFYDDMHCNEKALLKIFNASN